MATLEAEGRDLGSYCPGNDAGEMHKQKKGKCLILTFE